MTVEATRTSPAPAGGGTRSKSVEAAARGFERQLVELLARQLVATAQPAQDEGGDEDGAASAQTSAVAGMLPGTLADAVEAGGGLGLSAELQRALAQRQEARS